MIFKKKPEKFQDIPKKSFLVTTYVVKSYSSISHEVRLKALEKRLDRTKDRKISTNDLINSSWEMTS